MSRLASYALGDDQYIEREFPQEAHKYRTEFQRDRDRIVHSKAFRRLEYKTQVFVNHLGDNYRTRLTHSIEVSQIARTVSRSLKLNEDLTETLALAHDLGHTPFGHAGERALHKLMRNHEGFEHNSQTLRIVTMLEKRYPYFDGLNLTLATRRGLEKHSSKPGGQNHILESQVVDLCDEIAYNNHDLDDGIDSGYLSLEELSEVALWQRAWEAVHKEVAVMDRKIAVRYSIRWLINHMVSDLIENTLKNIKVHKIETFDDVLNYSGEGKKGRLASFSNQTASEVAELKKFLFHKLYRHPAVVTMNARAEEIVGRLFDFFLNNPDAFPEEFRGRAEDNGNIERVTSDFIAGMTDRYALYWNRRILGIDA